MQLQLSDKAVEKIQRTDLIETVYVFRVVSKYGVLLQYNIFF